VAKRGREGAAKRARERVRAQRKEDKRQRRESVVAAAEAEAVPDESALMEEFRVLSERHAAGLVTDETYADDRQRIFGELGIDTN
jgi:hypothetical protein